MKVKILLGHICSGKTKYAMEQIKNNNNVRLSMDDLKIMMFNKLSNDKRTEDIVAASINNILLLLEGLDDSPECVILDGFPLSLDSIHYIVSQFTTEIKIFTVDLFKANMRNRKRAIKDGIFIEPEEIKKYNNSFDIFIKSDWFKKISDMSTVTYFQNNESKKCLIM